MSRVEAVIGFAAKLTALQEEAAGLGLSIANAVHGVDRETFDRIPGDDRHFPASNDREHEFWSKTAGGIVYFTQAPVVSSVREAYGRPRERVF